MKTLRDSQIHHIRTTPTIQQRAKELRQRMSPAEIMLWQRLRAHRLNGLKFRRQHPLGSFIADFYCADTDLLSKLMVTFTLDTQSMIRLALNSLKPMAIA